MSTPILSDISAMRIDGLEKQGFILKGKRADTLDGTSLINIIIGENSAGKSRFLRTTLTEKASQIDIGSDLQGKLKRAVLKSMQTKGRVTTANVSATVINKALEKTTHPPLDSHLEIWINKTIENDLNNKNDLISPTDKLLNGGPTLDYLDVVSQTLGETLQKDLKELTRLCEPALKLLEKREYIPILRGLRPLDPQKDLFKERTNEQ